MSGVVKPRGRPRNLALRDSAVSAASSLLHEGGLGAVTMDAVAARSGVGKPTLYRWWPDRHALAMAALMASDVEERPGAPSIAALRGLLHAVVDRLSSRTGRQITAMLAASEGETELSKAFRHHVVLTTRESARAHLRALHGQDSNEDVTLDLLLGPLYFRLLVGHAPLTRAFADEVLEAVLKGRPG